MIIAARSMTLPSLSIIVPTPPIRTTRAASAIWRYRNTRRPLTIFRLPGPTRSTTTRLGLMLDKQRNILATAQRQRKRTARLFRSTPQAASLMRDFGAWVETPDLAFMGGSDKKALAHP